MAQTMGSPSNFRRHFRKYDLPTPPRLTLRIFFNDLSSRKTPHVPSRSVPRPAGGDSLQEVARGPSGGWVNDHGKSKVLESFG